MSRQAAGRFDADRGHLRLKNSYGGSDIPLVLVFHAWRLTGSTIPSADFGHRVGRPMYDKPTYRPQPPLPGDLIRSNASVRLEDTGLRPRTTAD
jgi:hypothetical protein